MNLYYQIMIYAIISLMMMIVADSVFKYYSRSVDHSFSDSNVIKVYIGMSRNEVKDLFGQPSTVIVDKQKSLETWEYVTDYSTNYLYFENNKLANYDITIYKE